MEDASPAVKKALAKLETNLAAGQSYEGHELFKTAFHRMRARHQTGDSYALALGGALLQLQKGQLHCGVELATMLIDAYELDNIPATELTLQGILQILDTLPTEPVGEDEDPPVEAAQKISAAALKWLRKVKGVALAPKIHAKLAEYITNSLGWTGLGAAIPHYARSADLDSYAAAVAEAAQEGADGEEDLFIVRAALSIVDAGKIVDGTIEGTPLARAARFSERYAAVSGRALPDAPLINFLGLFLGALQKRSAKLAALLLKEYDVALKRDRSLKELAEHCRDRHAPMPVQASGMPGGLFGGLLRGMMAP